MPRQSPAGAEAGDGRDGRHGAALDGIQRAVHLALVGYAILAILEVPELGDVGAGGKGLVAGAGYDQDLGLAGAPDAAADLGHPFIHRESERIARLRPIEGDPADMVALVVEQFLGHVLCRIETRAIIGEASWRWNGFSRALPTFGSVTIASISICSRGSQPRASRPRS